MQMKNPVVMVILVVAQKQTSSQRGEHAYSYNSATVGMDVQGASVVGF